jgi:hypothetical protein
MVGLCRLHEQSGLVAGVGDDLMGVGGAVVEQLLGVVACVRRLGVELIRLLAEGAGTLGERAGVRFGTGLKFFGDRLGMPQQRRGPLASLCCGAGSGGDLLTRSHH